MNKNWGWACWRQNFLFQVLSKIFQAIIFHGYYSVLYFRSNNYSQIWLILKNPKMCRIFKDVTLRRLKVRILNWPIPMADSAESARIPFIYGRFLIIFVHYRGCIIEELARIPRNQPDIYYQEERYQKISKIRTFSHLSGM